MKSLSRIEFLIDKLKNNDITNEEAVLKLQSFLNSTRNSVCPTKPTSTKTVATLRDKPFGLASNQSITPLSEKLDQVPDFPIDKKLQCSTSSSLQNQVETDKKFTQQLMCQNSKVDKQIKKQLKKASAKKPDYNFDCLDVLDSQSLFEEYCRFQNKKTSHKDSVAESENLEFSPFDLMNLKSPTKLKKKHNPQPSTSKSRTTQYSNSKKSSTQQSTTKNHKSKPKIVHSRGTSNQKTSFKEEIKPAIVVVSDNKKLIPNVVELGERKNSNVESVNSFGNTLSNHTVGSGQSNSKRPRNLQVYRSKPLSSPFSEKQPVQEVKNIQKFGLDEPLVEIYDIDIDSGEVKQIGIKENQQTQLKENIESPVISPKPKKQAKTQNFSVLDKRKSSKVIAPPHEPSKKSYIMKELHPVLQSKKNEDHPTPAKRIPKKSVHSSTTPQKLVFSLEKRNKGMDELEKKQKQLGIQSSRNIHFGNLASKLSINNIQRKLASSRSKPMLQKSNFEVYQTNIERGIKSPQTSRRKMPQSFDMSCKNLNSMRSMVSNGRELSNEKKVKKKNAKQMDIKSIAQIACQKAKKKLELLEDVENYLSSCDSKNAQKITL